MMKPSTIAAAPRTMSDSESGEDMAETSKSLWRLVEEWITMGSCTERKVQIDVCSTSDVGDSLSSAG